MGGVLLLGAAWMIQPVLVQIAVEDLSAGTALASAGGLAGVAVSVLSGARLMLASPLLRRPALSALLVGVMLLLLWLMFAALAYGMYRLERVCSTGAMAGAGAGLALLLIAAGRLLPTNCGSLHGFYRDRLSKAYFFKPWKGGAKSLDQFDDCQLSKIDATHCPYLLVNACLNVSDTPSRRVDLTGEYVRPGRRGSFFLFSREAVGCDSLDDVSASEFESVNGLEGSLATAMAISGAAFGSNMGYQTKPAAVALLTLLNVRTGCWVRFPVRGHSNAHSKSRCEDSPKPKPLLQRLLEDHAYLTLCREAVSRFDNKAGSLLLSDGGHVDNLGLYALLKRRCSLIIASAAEADPDYAFEGLAAAVRLAKIDLDVTVEIDYAHLAAISAGKRHFAVGSITYPKESKGTSKECKGTLIYLKSSLTDEALRNVSLLHYHRSNPAFPHETTADQFFTEQQFEAYRALGHFVCGKAFEGPGSDGRFADAGAV